MANEKKYVIALRHPEAYSPRDLGNREKQETAPTCCRRWNDLPEDLVGEIMVRLSCADRFRFAACCKKLLSLMPNYYHRGEIDQFPWLLKFGFRNPKNHSFLSYLFILFDPFHQTPYSVTRVREITAGPEILSGDRKRLLSSRNGWLLLGGTKQILMEEQEGKLPRFLPSLVLVSPFTKQIIALPDLDHSENKPYMSTMMASYSCDPSSPDCVHFVLWKTVASRFFRISTFCNGDIEWNNVQFRLSSFVGVVYHEGSFYFVNISGRMAVYDMVDNKSRSFTRPKPAKRHRDCKRYPYILVCEGKLLVVFLDVPFFEKTDQVERCIIFEYVQQQADWIEKTNLGHNSVYLSRFGSFSVSTSSDMSNRIYYVQPRGLEMKYYSLEDGKAYESSCWPGVERCGTWIEPPQLHTFPGGNSKRYHEE